MRDFMPCRLGERVHHDHAGPTVLCTWRFPSLGRVPASPVPRLQRYYGGATTSRPRGPGRLWFRFRAPRVPPVFVFAKALPTGTEDARRAWGIGQPAPRFRLLHPWARAGSLRFPGDPSYAYALFQDPGRADRTSPMAVLTMPPPVYPDRRPQRVHNLGADAGLQHPLSTLHERRHRRPCKTRFRLAGCASTGRGSNPLDRDERFQVTSTFSSPELALTQGSSTPSRPSVAPRPCWPTCRATRTASPSRTGA